MSALARLYEKSHTNRGGITPLEAAILELDDAPEDYSEWVNGAANELEGLHNKVKSQDDELATLRAQLAEARDALQPFTNVAKVWDGVKVMTSPIIAYSHADGDILVYLDDFRAARAWHEKVTTA